MGKHYLREDKTCENCGHTVEIAYCSNCGQKNTETRQSFGHLVGHVIEDIVHYDNAFWKTIKYLMFNPAKLTKEYLAGKRQTYVAPVKLYIFVSFITFFILALLPKMDEETAHEEEMHTESIVDKEDRVVTLSDKRVVHSIRELDSIQAGPESQRMRWIEYNISKALFKIANNDIDGEDFINSFIHNMPKVLFIYMPIFAFWLWLFHGKKRWYFFDHGIFTLHYFSFLLLSLLIAILLLTLLDIADIETNTFYFILTVLFTIISLYAIFYFFRSHRRMYGESRTISRLKSTALFFINYILIIIILSITIFYTILHLH